MRGGSVMTKKTKAELKEETEIKEGIEEGEAIQADEVTEGKPEVSEENELFKYKKQAEENQDRALRIQAEFDNYRKRVAKEKEDIYTISLEKIMKDILPIVDNFERAIAALKNDQLDTKYIEGVEMISTQLMSILVKHNLKEIDCENQEFDPNLHHAVLQCEAGEEDENMIKIVMQKGYMLGNRVIRPAMVQVAVK